jgi:hypothetical protein
MSPGPTHQKEMAERRAIIKGDQQPNLRPGEHEPSTMFAMANLDTGVTPSRVGKSYVAGSEPAVQYEAIPSGPWSSSYGRLPDEPPTGVAIDAQEPCGEPFEVARSLASLSATARISAEADIGAECAPVTSVAVETSAPNSSISTASAIPPESGGEDGLAHSIVRSSSPTFHRPARKL